MEEREKGERERPVLGLRAKKGKDVRTWLLIDVHGSAQIVEAGKHAMMRRACLPARDLRILDPQLSYPSTILGREHAIVVNLEHIKAIITAQEVLLLNSKDPAVEPFVQDLQRRLPLHLNGLGQEVPDDGGGGLSDYDGDGLHKLNKSSPTNPSSRKLSGNEPIKEDPTEDISRESQNGSHSTDKSTGLPQLHTRFRDDMGIPFRTRGGPNVLPFEFRALEACLEAACSSLDQEASSLEKEAYPALDELTSKISTLNLERVRQLKSRLVAISGRVQKVRDEIEQLLDDDGDMAEMYLTDKLLELLSQQEGSLSPNSTDHTFEPVSPSNDKPLLATAEVLLLVQEEVSVQSGGSISDGEDERSSMRTVSAKSFNVEELEMLLEAYFVQIDGTLNKLSTLKEYVDDTEDYINIMLDDKQNHLLQMGVMLTTATLVLSIFIVVEGIFGMNIHISLFDWGGTPQFLGVICGTAAICTVLYFAVIGWCKYNNLIE